MGLIMSSRNSRGLSAQATQATCSFFWSLTSLSPLHLFHLIFLLVFSLVFSSFSPRFLFFLFLSKYMSTTGALQDGNDGPLMEWDDNDNDNDNVSEFHVSQGISKTPSTFTASSQSLATSSQLSQPSGLPIDTIARLTHDELKHNPEFMRCLGMVNLLQELLNLRQKDAPICESPSFTPYFSLRSLCLFFFFFFLASTAVNSSGCSSLRPSESASQVSGVKPSLSLPFPRPLIRPACFPQSVLWTAEDCKNDPDARVTAANMSRFPMRRAIRHEDGTMITESQWKSIRQSAMLVARTHLESLTSTAPLSADQPRKKKYYKRFFPKEWDRALRELEGLAPLLSLCVGDWKADQTLGTVLQDEFDHSASPSHSVPPSRASTPSNLGPSSSGLVTSHTAPPSSAAPSSTVSRSSRAPSPRRVALKSSRPAPRPVQPPPEPAPASKPVDPKPKRRRDPSPTLRTGKKSKGGEDATSSASSAGAHPFDTLNGADYPADTGRRRPPSPQPAFLAVVGSRAAPQSVSPPTLLILTTLTTASLPFTTLPCRAASLAPPRRQAPNPPPPRHRVPSRAPPHARSLRCGQRRLTLARRRMAMTVSLPSHGLAHLPRHRRLRSQRARAPQMELRTRARSRMR